MGLSRGRWVSQGAGGALRGCGAAPVPSWQDQNEGEVSPGWLTGCCCAPSVGVTRTTATSCTPWPWGTNAWGASTSPCASRTSSGSGTSTTAWRWACRWDPAGATAGTARGEEPCGSLSLPLAQDILTHVVKKEFQALLAVDQLTLEREKNKVFLRFSECGDKGAAPPAATAAPGSPQRSPCHPRLSGVPSPGRALHEVPGAWGTLVCQPWV